MLPEACANSVLSNDMVEDLSHSEDITKRRDHDLPDSENEESIGDWEGDQRTMMSFQSELPLGHHSSIPGYEILEFLEKSWHSWRKVETALKWWKDYNLLVHSLHVLRRGQK